MTEPLLRKLSMAVEMPRASAVSRNGPLRRRPRIEVVASARTMAEAAARLGVTRSTLYRRMERYGLTPERILRQT